MLSIGMGIARVPVMLLMPCHLHWFIDTKLLDFLSFHGKLSITIHQGWITVLKQARNDQPSLEYNKYMVLVGAFQLCTFW